MCAALLVGLPATAAAHASTKTPAGRSAVKHSAAAPDTLATSTPSELVASANGDIAALRTATTQTFPVGNGQYQEDLYPAPVNYQAADHSWQPINTALAASGSSAEVTTAGDVVSSLPNDLSTGPVTVTSGGRSLGFQLVGAVTGAGKVAGATETWAGALPGVDVALTDGTQGVKEALTLHSSAAATAVFTYTLTVPSGATPALDASGGVKVTLDGSTFATIPAAFMDDASHTAAGHSTDVPYTLTQLTPTTWTLTMTPSHSWLTDTARVFPVVIDPTVYVSGGTGYEVCGISSATPTTGLCPNTTMAVGSNSGTYRAVAVFPSLTTTVPLDSVIVDAEFFPYQSAALNSNTQTVEVDQLTRAFTSGVTWNTYDGTHAWTTAGGDYTSAYNYGSAAITSTTGARKSIPMTNLVSQWVDGNLPNYGALIKVSSEPGSNLDTFASSSDSSGNGPELKVTYQARFGSTTTSTFTSWKITDGQTMGVNNADGNLVIDAKDLSLASVGIDTTVGHTYNSRRADEVSTLGYGWVFATGRDVRAYLDADNNIVYVAPGGNYYTFNSAGTGWTDAPGANASASYSATTHQVTITDHASQEVDVFGTNSQLATRTDRNGNVQTFNYDASNFTGDGLPYLDSITDTSGRTITFSKSYNQTAVSDPSGRATSYGFTGNKLTSFEDPALNTTHYAYDATDRITSVTTPNGDTYGIGYDSVNRVANISDPGGSCVTPVSKCTTFTYTNPTTPGPADGGTPTAAESGTTVVTDQLGHTTTYTWDHRDQILKAVDALGHSRSTSYTNNNSASTLTDGLSGISTNTYDGLNNQTQSQAPDMAGGGTGSGRTSKLGYPTPTGSAPYAGSDYEATSSTGTEGNNPTTMAYDTAGNMMTVTPPSGSGGIALNYSHQGDSGVTSCSGHAGQLCKSTDGNGNATTYTYSGSPLYQLVSVTQPTPLGSTATTYDSVGRVHTVTDPKGQKTTTTYDADDHVTEVQLNGISTCTTADISAGNCTKYTYDYNGNLKTRIDSTGTTTWLYTAKNQEYDKAIPGQTTDSSVVYDDAGNITSYTDAGGTVTYVYDPANQLWALAEPGGSCPAYSATTPPTIPNTTKCTAFTLDNNGNRTQVAYPSGEKVNYAYDTSQRITLITAYHNGSSTAFFKRTLSYTDTGGHDRSLLQTTADGVSSPVTSTYGYDVYQRLTSDAVGTTSYGYSYDQAGNRLTSTKTGSSTQYYGYNNANQLCWSGTTSGSNGTTACPTTPTGDSSYTYDADGNQNGGTPYTITYSPASQSTAFTVGGTTTTATYAGDNQTERVTTGATTLINGLEGVAGQTNGTSVYFTRDPDGNLISMRQGAGGTSTNSYYLLDQQASVLAITGADGTTDNATYTYDPYGVTLTATGTLATTNPYRYATSYYDSATGLYKLGERYYCPTLGRFTQPDASGHEANLYAYAADDPSNSTDPSGEIHTKEHWSGVNIYFSSNDLEVLLGIISIAGGAAVGVAAGVAAGIAACGELGPIAVLCGIIGSVIGYTIADIVYNDININSCGLNIKFAWSGKLDYVRQWDCA